MALERLAYERVDKAGKGALLRREGLCTSLISEWRRQRDRGALQALAKPAGRPAGRSPRPVGRPAASGEPAAAGRACQGPQVIEVQGMRSALLEQLATDSVTEAPQGETG
jgi:hypothetical protein